MNTNNKPTTKSITPPPSSKYARWSDKEKMFILARQDQLLAKHLTKIGLTSQLNEAFGTNRSVRAVQAICNKLGCSVKPASVKPASGREKDKI